MTKHLTGIPRRWINRFRRRVDTEDEQLLGRLMVCIMAAALYTAVPSPSHISFFVSAVCAAVATVTVVLLILAGRAPRDLPSPARRLTMLLVDVTALTVMLALGQRYAAPFWGLFLWLTLDVGFRYGSWYLRTAVPLCAAGFAVPLFIGGSFWAESFWLWASMELTLVVVPLAVWHQVTLNERTMEKVREGSRQKMRLLGHLTTTLQTPLGGILRAAEAIQQAPENTRGLVDVIAVSARHMIILTQDMLDAAAIEAGKLTRQECAFDVREVGNEAISALLAAAEAKGVLFQVSVDESVPELVYADLAHMRQILVYCLDRILTAANNTVRLRIATGVEDGTQHVRFEVTTQDVNVSVEREYLAVTMAPALIEFLGGKTGPMQSGDREVGLWVTLPCLHLQQAPPQLPVVYDDADTANILAFTDPFIRHRNTVPKLRILAIEDQASQRYLIERILARAGHTVDAVETGEAGLTALEAAVDSDRNYDAVLVDLHLPDQPGSDVIRMINFMRVGVRVPLIVITADRSDAALAACRDAGVSAFLTKPLKPTQLLDSIALAASLRAGGQSSAPSRPQPDMPRVLQTEDTQAREFVRRCLADADIAIDRLSAAATRHDWTEAMEHAYAVYAVAVSAGDRSLIDATSQLYEMPVPSFKVHWRSHVEQIHSAIGWLRETNTRLGHL